MKEYKNKFDSVNQQQFKEIVFDDKVEISSMAFNKVQIPQFIERINSTKKWIDFGQDNQFPQYLQSLLSKSALHQSIINSNAKMIGSYGWLKTNLDLKTMLFLRNAKSDFDLDEILEKVSIDLEVYGAFALNVVWSKDRESISEINYIDVAKVRIEAPDPKFKYPSLLNYWFCDNWSNPRKNPPVLYQGFSTRYKRSRSQIYYIKQHQAGNEFYSRVGYLPAIRSMETDWLIQDWQMNGVKNGYTPGYIITIPGMGSSPEQRRAIADRLRSDLAGTGNANVGYIQFTNSTGESPKFEPIELNNSDVRFLSLIDEIQKAIMRGHEVKSPKLYGEGGDGGITIGVSKNEMLEAVEIFQNSYATGKQNILEKVFNRLARVNGITDNLIIKKYHETYRKVDTNLQDIIDILNPSNGLDPEQQYWVLVQNGYAHEIASKFSKFDGGKSLAETTGVNKSVPIANSEFENVWNELKFMSINKNVNPIDLEEYTTEYFGFKKPEYITFSKSKPRLSMVIETEEEEFDQEVEDYLEMKFEAAKNNNIE